MNWGESFLQTVPEGRVFALDAQMFFSVGIILFNVILLAVALSFILYKPVREFMRKRTERIEAQFSLAANDVLKANELKAQYEEKLKNIEVERSEILETAQKLAAEKSKQIVEEAKREANTVKERAMAEVQMERAQFKEEAKASILDLSSAMAEKFMMRAIDSETQNKLFDETIKELEETVWLS